MKIAISSHDGKMNTPFSQRFGRCEYFLIFDTESEHWETIENPAATASGGAGATVVQFLFEHDIQATITGRYGPNAFKALEAAGIQPYEAAEGTPEKLVQQLLLGKLSQVNAPTGKNRHGHR